MTAPANLYHVYLYRGPAVTDGPWIAVPLDAAWLPTEPTPIPEQVRFDAGLWPAESREDAIRDARKAYYHERFRR